MAAIDFESDKKQKEQAASAISHWAGLSKDIIDRYLQESKLGEWVFFSILLISGFLIIQRFSKESIFLPFLMSNEQGMVELIPSATSSAILKHYLWFGKNIAPTFNDLASIFLLILVALLFFITILKLLSKFPLLQLVFRWLLCRFPFIKSFLDNFPRRYTEHEWLADPKPLQFPEKLIYPSLGLRIPAVVRRLNFIRFGVHILEDYDHWRAGIFIEGADKSKDYVFHVYKNAGDPQLRTRITMRDFKRSQHVEQSDKNVQIPDTHKFLFEVAMVGSDTYALRINNQEVDRYKVPKEDFNFIRISAWADDRPYKIKFTDIEFFG